MTIVGDLRMIRHDARTLLMRQPHSSVEAQDVYRAVRDWAQRGMGYGLLADHPATSGERDVLEFLKSRMAGEAPVIFDVGANVGLYAHEVVAAGLAERYYGFEPSTEAFEKLYDAVKQGVYGLGLSDIEGTRPLYTDAPGSGMASVYDRRLDHFGRELGVEERAEFRRLDNVCRDLGVARIDLLKIDVEGHELAVLRGAGYMLRTGAIRMIQWEMGGCNLDSRTTFQDFWYLLHERYDLYRVVSDGLAAIPEYREQDEVFVCSNFVAVWRNR